MAAEDELFQRYQRTRRPAVLAEIYDLVAPELFDVALHLTGSPAEAEDALQSTFATAIERADSFDPARRVVPWLLGILANQARLARTRARREIEPERLQPQRSEDPAEQAERLELAERLDASLREVPAPFQSVLILRLEHGLSVPEIAHALRRPPGTVRSQLQRGLEILRRVLPASFAGAALATSLAQSLGAARGLARGLDAVRAEIVAHAAALEPAGIGLASITGALVMNKLVVAGSAAAVALVVAYLALGPSSASSTSTPDGPSDAVESKLLAHETVDEPARGTALAAAPAAADREPGSELAPPPAAPEDAARPTGGLLVRARMRSNGEAAAGIAVIASYHSAGWSIPAERFGLTGDDGTLLLEDLPPTSVHVRLPQGADGHAVVRLGERATLDLLAFDGVTVDGVVVDAGGRGVAGAEIWLSERYLPHKGHVVARADSSGRFELSSIGPDLFIGAQADGYALSGTQNVNGSPGDRIPMRLVLATRAATVKGRVVGSTGEPVAGAVVLIGDEFPRYDVQVENGKWMPSPAPQRAVTGADGRFAARCVPLGTVPVLARANGLSPWTSELLVIDGRNEVEIALRPQARIVGRVLDARGSPVALALVHNEFGAGLCAANAYSSPDGRFELYGLGSGPQKLIAEHTEHGRAEVELELAAGETRERDFVLDATPRIFGTVRERGGRALPDMLVVAFRPSDGQDHVRSAITRADGVYSLAVGDDAAYTLLVQQRTGLRSFPLEHRDGVRASLEPLDLTVDLSEASTGRVRGVVLGPDGRPRSGVEVALWHESQSQWRSFPVDADTGQFEIARVPPGDVRFEVQSSEYPKVRIGEQEVRGGEELDLGTTVLAEAVHFTIAFDGGPEASMASLFVQLAREQEWVPMVRQDARRYRSAPLAPGKYQLRVQGDFIAPFVAEYDVAGEREERVRLERAGLRRIRFRTSEDVGSLKHVACSVLAPDGRMAWMNGNVQPVEGVYELRVSLPPGDYRLYASAWGRWSGEASFTMEGLGEGAPMEIVLQPVAAATAR